MRIRLALSTVAVCLLLVMACALVVHAQTQCLAERNSFWESRIVIGLPGTMTLTTVTAMRRATD